MDPDSKCRSNHDAAAVKGRETVVATSSSASDVSEDYLRGYIVIVSKLRAVTLDPMGFLLTDLLHARVGDERPLPDELREHRFHPNWEALDALTSDFESVLTDWIESKGDVTLSKKMTEPLEHLEMNISRQHHSKQSLDENGTSFLVHSSNTPALLIEVGFGMDDWWTQAGHAVNYVNRLLRKRVLVKPVIMAVFFVATSESTGAVETAQLGVFLVVPKVGCDYRVAPLWRSQSPESKTMASAFARILHAAQFAAEWNWSGKESLVDYEYLGSHCCRIGKRVRTSTRERTGSALRCKLSDGLLVRSFRCIVAMTIDFATLSAVRNCTWRRRTRCRSLTMLRN
jgi:hypothetical protein